MYDLPAHEPNSIITGSRCCVKGNYVKEKYGRLSHVEKVIVSISVCFYFTVARIGIVSIAGDCDQVEGLRPIE